jgi:hypothetical protein
MGKAKNEFEYFEIKRGDWKDELGERMDVAGKLLYRSVEIGEENLSIGKENLSVTKSIKKDTGQIKQDTALIYLQ